MRIQPGPQTPAAVFGDALEPVVDQREQCRAVFLRLELPRDAALGLGAKLGAPFRAPAVHELPRRIELDDPVVTPVVLAREHAPALRESPRSASRRSTAR